MTYLTDNFFKIATLFLAVAVGVLFWKVHFLTEAYESEHPVVVMDWTDIANISNYANKEAAAQAVDAAYQVADDLAAAGYIVVDGRGVTRAVPTAIVGSEQIKTRLQHSKGE